MSLTRCQVCRKAYVPEIVLSTIEIPEELYTIGNGILVEAYVCRPKKFRVGDSRANAVSEAIPFAQYDLHRQLMYKLRIHGLNAIFGLKIQFTVGESLMTAVATGTAIYARALPQPSPLKVLRNLDVIDDEDERLMDIQKKIMAQSEMNRTLIEAELATFQRVKKKKKKSESGTPEEDAPERPSVISPPEEESSESESDSSTSDLDIEPSNIARQNSFIPSAVRKQTRGSVVQIDDEQDEDLVLFLDDNFLNVHMMTVEQPPSSLTCVSKDNLQTFQMVTLIKQSLIDMSSHHPNRQLAGIFKSLYQDLQYQLSYFSDCIVVGVDYDIHLSKENSVQICMTAMAIGQLIVWSPLTNPVDQEAQDLEDRDETARFGMASRRSLPSAGPSSKVSGGYLPTRIDSTDNVDRSTNSSISEPREEEYFDEETEAPSSRERPSLQKTDQGSGGIDTDSGMKKGGSLDERKSELSLARIPPSGSGSYIHPIPVEISPLSYIPLAKTVVFLGRMSLHFIKESTLSFDSLYGASNGMGGFAHEFMAELYAIVRAHVVALGGNAMTSFVMDQQMFSESLKNQGYALFCVSGDVVKVSYDESRPPQLFYASDLFERSNIRF